MLSSLFTNALLLTDPRGYPIRQRSSFGDYYPMNNRHPFATLGLSLGLCLPAAVFAATVSPDDVKALPIGTSFVGIPSGEFVKGTPIPQNKGSEVELLRTADGFTYIHANEGRGGSEAQKVVCNNITRSGGKGNANINCELPGGKQIRFEWLDLDKVKYEYWFSMKDKAGQTQNKPGQASVTLVKKEPVRTGKVIPPGVYTVNFDASLNWASVTYVLEANGKFSEKGAKPREGTWQEIDGDFCHIDSEVHCYKLLPRAAGDKAFKLQYKSADGSNSYGATWTPK